MDEHTKVVVSRCQLYLRQRGIPMSSGRILLHEPVGLKLLGKVDLLERAGYRVDRLYLLRKDVQA
jgi:hypothetical protein